MLKVQVGCSIRSLLCKQTDVASDYVDERISTVFLDGKPVDDVDSAIVKNGSVLALSAAMPGLAEPPGSVPKFHFGTPSDCQLKNEGCPSIVTGRKTERLKDSAMSTRFICLIFYLIALPVSVFAHDKESVNEFSLVTYNVLAEAKYIETRIPTLLNILENTNADIIALQETASWFFKSLNSQAWAKKYYYPLYKNKVFIPRGLLILSKHPVTGIVAKKLPGRQKRALLIVKTKIGNTVFSVGTCHLESPLGDGHIRAKQLDLFFDIFSDSDNALFLGDFNFGENEQPDTSHLDKAFTDVWSATNPGKPGYTWNREESIMARRNSFPNEESRRIDRILLKSKLFKPVSARVIGNSPVSGKYSHIFPSDHFGLFGTIQRYH
ncbi:MAG: endonuclease/exonuclease/phosphatase family protein [Desulfobacterales bacterium]|nr:endonuclease/exonuclease/phosphatase family protein [Desulfobacterales bacterium]